MYSYRLYVLLFPHRFLKAWTLFNPLEDKCDVVLRCRSPGFPFSFGTVLTTRSHRGDSCEPKSLCRAQAFHCSPAYLILVQLMFYIVHSEGYPSAFRKGWIRVRPQPLARALGGCLYRTAVLDAEDEPGQTPGWFFCGWRQPGSQGASYSKFLFLFSYWQFITLAIYFTSFWGFCIWIIQR